MKFETDRAQRVTLALEGLMPLVWMERCAVRCVNPRRPTRDELWPDDMERNLATNAIVMADTLVAGGKGRGALTAVAKALVYLSLAPGGVKALGLHVEAVDEGDTVRLEVRKL